MTAPYGDRYPLGDKLPDPAVYDTAGEVGELAKYSADAILATDPFNYGCAEMHMRALAGLFNGAGNFDEQTFNRMTPTAQTALRNVAGVTRDYFSTVGILDKVIEETDWLYPNGASEYASIRILIGQMQLHVSISDMREAGRRQSAMIRAIQNHGELTADYRAVEDPEQADRERMGLENPYNEQGIRRVLKVFGDSLAPVITCLHDIAPLNVDGRAIVHHASSSIHASIPHDFRSGS